MAPPKFDFGADQIESLLDLISTRGELVQAASMSSVSADPDDDEFIACALSAKAEFLVKGNKRHYKESWLS